MSGELPATNGSSMDASLLLEAALQQMDGIIAGAQLELASLPDSTADHHLTSPAALCHQLRYALTMPQMLDCEGDEVDDETRHVLVRWLSGGRATAFKDAVQVRQLEGSKATLELQAAVLTEQVEAQAEKIADLEDQLAARGRLLADTEDRLQKEVLAVSGLETQRLQLLSELSTLQLRQVSVQHGAQLPHLQPGGSERPHIAASTTSTPVRGPPTQLSPLLAGFSSPTLSNISALSALAPSTASPPPSTALQPYDTANNNNNNYGAQRTVPVNDNRQLDQRPIRSGSTSSATRPSGTLPQPLNLNDDNGNYNGTSNANTLPTNAAYAETEKDDLELVPALQDSSSQQPIEDRQTYGPADGHAGAGYGRSSSPGGTAGGQRKSPTSLKTLSSGNLHNIHTIQQYSEQQNQPTSPITSHKPTTIKKIFTRLRRSSSGHVRSGEEPERGGRSSELRRGGIRATATARLGWAPNSPSAWQEPPSPFLTWTTADCVKWLDFLGLAQYTAALKCWHNTGNHLSRATPSQLDKQLGVRHPLHRKKLQLAIGARMGLEGSLARGSPGHHIEGVGVSTVWMSQWLDDVGLPQYKDVFHGARVDPRVLNVLTWDDLAFLKVVSLLHATSLKRGVQVLREHNFDSTALIRRSGTTDPSEETDNGRTDNDNNNVGSGVCLWTNHRVMEWLRTVDLSEYAPNLRGSGVHGALLVYEVRFNAEVLAALLSIPSNKTLLRRHLNTHFKELVGREVVLEKRQVEDMQGYIPLSTATKIKPSKRSQFSLKRRSSSKGRSGQTLEFDDLLCPLEERPPRGTLQQAIESSPETRLC